MNDEEVRVNVDDDGGGGGNGSATIINSMASDIRASPSVIPLLAVYRFELSFRSILIFNLSLLVRTTRIRVRAEKHTCVYVHTRTFIQRVRTTTTT